MSSVLRAKLFRSIFGVATGAPVRSFAFSMQRDETAEGMDELTATHKAADDAVAKFRTVTQAKRKAKFGPDAVPHRLTTIEARRIAGRENEARQIADRDSSRSVDARFLYGRDRDQAGRPASVTDYAPQ